MVTSNHVHLLAKDIEEGMIPRAIQLIAGQTAQEYNRRKGRLGAFWEDRYHATAIETDAHLHRCLVYIDLNMVRAGVVRHPAEWAHSGYRDIQQPPTRYGVIDLRALSALCGFHEIAGFQHAHQTWVEAALEGIVGQRDACWSESIAVGSERFVEQVRTELGVRARHRKIAEADEAFVLREPSSHYKGNLSDENRALSPENAFLWQTISKVT